ncbi:UNVERIFIED_CONTAM: hypothetical protein K2H54_043140 [Gekko kuhli]
MGNRGRLLRGVQPLPYDCPVHSFQSGDWVLIKVAVKTTGPDSWVHHTRVKKVPDPDGVPGGPDDVESDKGSSSDGNGTAKILAAGECHVQEPEESHHRVEGSQEPDRDKSWSIERFDSLQALFQHS